MSLPQPGDIELRSFPQELAKEVLDLISARVNDIPYFPSINTAGGAGGSRHADHWIGCRGEQLGVYHCLHLERFQRIVFGIAAVVALIHDVLITLGALAASA